ncbi:hypothetical protein ANOM_002152 [Aspergillus nomiae NRRL 13137]|uniref:Uncharacterized protein n=1 Tax=Aspergillus nomiae NRRL (strain ATCC 15546 / NRRL 13137 / CBS 260.88 / M93) TaxID=1509407 RepID=A0A0L1JBT5_ASPN3|nr:uncharacterized protein ANOM_002152 [Aspergillus nomiae NRRL 13137]KNG89214.1 hypothetical protein ANOM_002152 [Aspergillus nomiae NRRL 13137]
MLLSQVIFPLSLLATAYASAIPARNSEARSPKLKWGPCGFNGTLPIECSKLDVPLDYTDKDSTATLSLDLIRVAAVNKPSRGSILFNFGGPGGDGLQNLASIADVMQPMTGGYHDMISFDPRGTGNTLNFSCYDNAIERTVSQLTLHQELVNSSDTALGRLWTSGKVFSDTCLGRLKDNATLVGTAFVARDMMQIVDALGEDGKLRYWGISYGTVLGATVASMFPDRMDKVILDGVQNPHEYYHGLDFEMFTDAGKAFEGFLSGCVDSPNNCPLARGNTTAASLGRTLSHFLETVKYQPIQIGQSIIDYSTIKSQIFSTLYWPGQWAQLAALLDGLMTGNLTDMGAGSGDSSNSSPGFSEALAGIKCGDKSTRATSLSDVTPLINKSLQSIKWFGDVASTTAMQCIRWGGEAKERYSGNFHVKTKNPVLLIGNTYDPATPLVSARNVSAGLEGSVVLQQNSYGHTSIAQPSNCTIRHIQQYFLNGTLPTPGTVCEPNYPLFHKA